MKWKITQQQMDNLKAALAFWLTVPAETVNLCHWREDVEDNSTPHCGSAACFGGWLPYASHFQALGVYAEPACGRPVMPQEHSQVSAALFGWRLFDVRGGVAFPGQPSEYAGMEWNHLHLTDDRELPDHRIVIRRLEHAINNSEVQA